MAEPVGTLTPGAVATVTLSGLAETVTVRADGTDSIWFTTDGTNPTANNPSLPRAAQGQTTVTVDSLNDPTVVKLISPGAVDYRVSSNLDAAQSGATAAAVTVTPAGNIAATDVQAALVELDTEKEAAGVAILKSVVDAAGDLIVGTGADTVGRLAKGAALDVLRVNAGGTALEWAAPSGGGITGLGTGTNSTLVGTSAVASSNYSTAIGARANAATGTQAIAIGGAISTTAAPSATGQGAIAVGASNATGVEGPRASGGGCIAIGSGDGFNPAAAASGDSAVAIGYRSIASTDGAIGIGKLGRGQAAGAIGIGNLANASGTGAIALGDSAVASHANAVALGSSVTTTATNQVNLGTRRLHLGVPTTAPADADLVNSQASIWVNEAGNTLSFKVKFSNGTVKNGTLAIA